MQFTPNCFYSTIKGSALLYWQYVLVVSVMKTSRLHNNNSSSNNDAPNSKDEEDNNTTNVAGPGHLVVCPGLLESIIVIGIGSLKRRSRRI